MMGADSNYEANSKKVLWSYCYKALLINLFWGTYRGYRQKPENSKLIAERKYGEGMEKNSNEGLVLDLGLC